MRILVTGSSGFVGRHLVRHLIDSGHEPLCFDLVAPAGGHGPAVQTHTGDLLNAAGISELISTTKPDGCIHLGGIAFVPMGWKDPNLVFSVNLTGTVNLMEAFRAEAPKARIVIVTSSEVYGMTPRQEAITEESPLTPSNLYGVSKMAADLSAQLYAKRYGMPVVVARPLNHIGPGQSLQFVTSAFAAQLIDIAQGKKEPVMRVGNLETERDFTDVRDVVRAYRLLMEKGRPGEAYNIASGTRVKIRTVLDLLCDLAGAHPRIDVDPRLFRPTDSSPVIETAKIRKEAGWQPDIPLQTTLRDILDAMPRDTSPAHAT